MPRAEAIVVGESAHCHWAARVRTGGAAVTGGGGVIAVAVVLIAVHNSSGRGLTTVIDDGNRMCVRVHRLLLLLLLLQLMLLARGRAVAARISPCVRARPRGRRKAPRKHCSEDVRRDSGAVSHQSTLRAHDQNCARSQTARGGSGGGSGSSRVSGACERGWGQAEPELVRVRVRRGRVCRRKRVN
jgi:hypothetical protein